MFLRNLKYKLYADRALLGDIVDNAQSHMSTSHFLSSIFHPGACAPQIEVRSPTGWSARDGEGVGARVANDDV